MRFLPFGGTFCVLSLILACSSINCPLNNTVTANYRFYKAGGEYDTLSGWMTVTTTRSDGTDSVLINQESYPDSFSLPMSYTHEYDELFFSFLFTDSTTLLDTVKVRKQDWPHFESPDCNAVFFHEIVGAECTRHALDSIVINDKNVNFNATKLHIRLYLRPDL